MADIRRQRSLTGTAEPARVIGAFAAVAALLAGLGLSGVLAQTVQQQRREMGFASHSEPARAWCSRTCCAAPVSWWPSGWPPASPQRSA